jgi:nucleotide-binding universal stress UspA family protein
MFQHCLVCTDLSDGLHRLIDFVPNLASGGLQQIVFFHSVPLWEEGEVPRIDEETIKQVEKRLSQALKTVPEGVEVKVEVSSGPPLETIPRILATYHIDVILVGTPIRSRWEERIFGSTSTALARLTPTPLTILRPQLISTYTCEELALRSQHLWRSLLIPYNDSESARYLLERIKAQAENRPLNSLEHCLLVWVIDDGGRREVITAHRLQEAQDKLEIVKAELAQLELAVDVEIRQGNPLQEVLDAAVNSDISAIAIASDYRSKLLEWTVPSFANEVLHRSWFPVVFFSPKQ